MLKQLSYSNNFSVSTIPIILKVYYWVTQGQIAVIKLAENSIKIIKLFTIFVRLKSNVKILLIKKYFNK